jgi:hypothetical protein
LNYYRFIMYVRQNQKIVTPGVLHLQWEEAALPDIL